MPTSVRPVPLLVLALVLAVGARPGTAKEGPAPFEVHEWGTFTSMQGSDGVALEGLQHEEERLPDFVYSRTQVRECPLRAQGYKGLEVPVSSVTEKMETPVLYFHTDVPRRVRVRVDFVGGLITQWYPVSDRLGPPELTPADGPLDVATVERSFLQWDADLLPSGGEPPAEVPEVGADEPWAFARAVDAAWVRTRPREEPGRLGPVEAERYLFYRGLGTFRLPLRVEASAGGGVRVINDGDRPHAAVYVLEVDAAGRVRFARLGTVRAHADRSFTLAERGWRDGPEDLQAMLGKDLTGQGLRDDEAVAMIRTWTRQWFASEGTRVMYVVPRETTDALLPLSIEPAPDRLVRVLVGRLEYMTPEVEEEVAAALRALAPDAPEAGRAAATARLMRLGRFLEPHLRRALARAAADDPLRAPAASLLASIGAGAPW